MPGRESGFDPSPRFDGNLAAHDLYARNRRRGRLQCTSIAPRFTRETISSKSCLSYEARLFILAGMTKPETDAIETVYKDNLGKMFNALFDAYIQGQGPADDAARKAADDCFV